MNRRKLGCIESNRCSEGLDADDKAAVVVLRSISFISRCLFLAHDVPQPTVRRYDDRSLRATTSLPKQYGHTIYQPQTSGCEEIAMHPRLLVHIRYGSQPVRSFPGSHERGRVVSRYSRIWAKALSGLRQTGVLAQRAIKIHARLPCGWCISGTG
jgi:hypothetical protein